MTLISERQIILFQPQGRMDLEGGVALSKKMAELLPERDQLWVIDLAEVDFMDSSGLVALVNGLKAARQQGCRLMLCNVQAPVRLVLEITKLDLVFEIVDHQEEISDFVNKSNLQLVR
ncbi:MAG: anti-sigma factor antagonist [Mastigocladus sp. ERB_26_2]|mgnify:CR=1 FL=1|uniref:Anti-sigma factor antagonist n=1 Tax=Fischerella muscicola CCMEE 5323 TaxID=2019572 RepID=A0A2N6K4T8_FISMU|nr:MULTISPECIES: STAS domain-containing protein [Fischerella]MBD2431332.1 STAS domain-containing protein [Fischerella sp. FACHB-380]PLZ91268.1 anti-sigma factor antagonist [Fischerella muscicola CCMEE 5323]